MIVDDNKEFLDELKEFLFLCGYDVVAVSSSLNAFKAAQMLKPDAILLDLKMGEKNGFSVAQDLKKSPTTSHIPIIAMSGHFPIEKKSILLDMSNMSGQIKKPFAISDLITQLEKVLGEPKMAPV